MVVSNLGLFWVVQLWMFFHIHVFWAYMQQLTCWVTVMCTLSFSRYSQRVSQIVCTNLHSHQQSMRITDRTSSLTMLSIILWVFLLLYFSLLLLAFLVGMQSSQWVSPSRIWCMQKNEFLLGFTKLVVIISSVKPPHILYYPPCH